MLTIKIKDSSTHLVLSLIGEIDLSTAGELEETVNAISHKAEHITVDFTQVSFIDSTGIGAVISLILSSMDAPFELEFKGESPMVRELFEMVGVYKVLSVAQKEG
ncbi:STAS domain-containing protein [Alkalihalophilus marmarensis]|uniref:STAS domain-containing protein n=1 Tax=Alkalihalophilus marmarensis TaxID=521377 RepID=UPI00203D98CF|nr:STAS domain-containing protein [Alkalihalophilus marmarensis]MCM3489867.1 STAS domain-containing protein [Alkalihalophilus marmarensis]